MSSDQAEERLDTQLVVFSLADELYGLHIAAVREIITWQKVTRIPRTPKYVEGIINVRGNVIPVVDLRKQFDIGVAQRGRQTRIIVVEYDDQVVGFVVDGVSEVLSLASSQIDAASSASVATGIDAGFIEGVARTGERLVILLDVAQVLAGREHIDDSEPEEAADMPEQIGTQEAT